MLTERNMAEDDKADAMVELMATFTSVVENEEEKDKFFRKTTKEKLLDLADAFRLSLVGCEANMHILEKQIQAKNTEIENKQLEINSLKIERDNANEDNKTKQETIDDQKKKLTKAKSEALAQLSTTKTGRM